MKRRTRPLDAAETRSVDVGSWMDLEYLHDVDDYQLKWPDAPLARLLRHAATREREVNVVTAPSERSAWVPITMPPPPSGGGDRKRGRAADADVLTGVVVADEWITAVCAIDGRAEAGWSAGDDNAAAAIVSLLEAAADKAWRVAASDSGRGQDALHRAAVPAVVAAKAQGGFSAAAVQCVADRWLAERLATSTTARPWGVPLEEHRVEPMPLDEYFIPCKPSDAHAAAKPWLTAATPPPPPAPPSPRVTRSRARSTKLDGGEAKGAARPGSSPLSSAPTVEDAPTPAPTMEAGTSKPPAVRVAAVPMTASRAAEAAAVAVGGPLWFVPLAASLLTERRRTAGARTRGGTSLLLKSGDMALPPLPPLANAVLRDVPWAVSDLQGSIKACTAQYFAAA
jgi:hypothetical protein